MIENFLDVSLLELNTQYTIVSLRELNIKFTVEINKLRKKYVEFEIKTENTKLKQNKKEVEIRFLNLEQKDSEKTDLIVKLKHVLLIKEQKQVQSEILPEINHTIKILENIVRSNHVTENFKISENIVYAVEANQKEILCWCFYTIKFKDMVKDFMVNGKIGEKKAKGQFNMEFTNDRDEFIDNSSNSLSKTKVNITLVLLKSKNIPKVEISSVTEISEKTLPETEINKSISANLENFPKTSISVKTNDT
ncbi:hypothetical protein Glove_408g4 [Diversispora epigaea]|uniref:Uncharacterized protein n=1 Tax=Diversispora epigaea TaxID=1348612 RepID=A0A397H3I5_9GLOM|nr:hypothetical protein Glove_408g4 [Diversispora epigaea]